MIDVPEDVQAKVVSAFVRAAKQDVEDLKRELQSSGGGGWIRREREGVA